MQNVSETCKTSRRRINLFFYKVCELSEEEIAAIPADSARDIAQRIHDAAEIGNVMTLNSIAEEIKAHADSCVPLGKQILQLAEDFDLEGAQKLADFLDAS